MKMLIFQICLFLWNNNAVNAECLPKHGFGLSQSVDPVPVDGDYSFQSDLSECQTRCDTLVVGFLVLVILDARTHSLPRNVLHYHFRQLY